MKSIEADIEEASSAADRLSAAIRAADPVSLTDAFSFLKNQTVEMEKLIEQTRSILDDDSVAAIENRTSGQSNVLRAVAVSELAQAEKIASLGDLPVCCLVFAILLDF